MCGCTSPLQPSRRAGCKGFDAAGVTDGSIDAPADAPAPAPPALVAAHGDSTGDSGTAPITFVVPITSVVAGDLLVVAITDHNGTAVASIVDSTGTALISTNAFAVNGTTSSEIWYESESTATDSVTVTMTTGSYFDVFVGEFSGIRPGPPAAVAKNCVEYPPTIASADVTTTAPGSLVVTATMNAYPLYVSQMLAPFTGFPAQTGNDAGYYIAAVPGTYGSTFDIDSGAGMSAMTCASSAAWLPI